MSRYKTFDSSGIAPAGRLYAGDLNAIQDQMADLYNLAQAAGVASLAFGESGLILSRYAAGVLGLAGTLRVSQIINAISGFQVNGTALASTHLSDSAQLARLTDVSAAAIPAGVMHAFPGVTLPSGYLWADGAAYSRTTYANLFAALVTSLGAATISIASPGVITRNAHGLVNGDVVYFETTGALPTGISADTPLYVVGATTNTFNVSATKGGAAINTSGTQSGTHTLYRAPHAKGTMGATTFNVPDMTGRSPIGKNAGTFQNLGGQGGEETHLLINGEMPVHNHGGVSGATSGGTPSGAVAVANAGAITTGTESVDHSHSGTTGGRSVGHTHSGTTSTDPGHQHGIHTVNSPGSLSDQGWANTTGSSQVLINTDTAGSHSHTMTTGTESADHTHSFTTGGRSAAHTHSVPAHGHTATFTGDVLATHTHSISSDGGGTAHNNLHPYTVCNFIIKT